MCTLIHARMDPFGYHLRASSRSKAEKVVSSYYILIIVIIILRVGNSLSLPVCMVAFNYVLILYSW